MRPLPNPPPLRKGGSTKTVLLAARGTAGAVTPTTAINTTFIRALVRSTFVISLLINSLIASGRRKVCVVSPCARHAWRAQNSKMMEGENDRRRKTRAPAHRDCDLRAVRRYPERGEPRSRLRYRRSLRRVGPSRIRVPTQLRYRRFDQSRWRLCVHPAGGVRHAVQEYRRLALVRSKRAARESPEQRRSDPQ